MSLTIRTADDLAAERAAQERDAARAEALAYLAETDWFVTRLAETGKPVPDDVAARRATARKAASA
jgi:hypothetical protein